jgi:hypothetical protein
MVLPDDCEEMVGRSSGVEWVECGCRLGLAAALLEWTDEAVGGGVCSCEEGCGGSVGVGWDVGVSCSTSSLSGLAMRRPPRERDRLRSSFIVWL